VQQFLSDYFKAIDLLAVAGIAAASFKNTGRVGLVCAAIVVAVWGALRIFDVR
jgi:hypothetical protein